MLGRRHRPRIGIDLHRHGTSRSRLLYLGRLSGSLQRAVEGSEERSDLQPEVPIDLRELLFERSQIDLHCYHLLVRRCRLHQSPMMERIVA